MIDQLPPPLRTYFSCINAERWAAFEAIWHPDADFTAVGARPRHGIEDILEYFQSVFRPWASHNDQPTRVLPSGSSATIEVHFTGTTQDGRTLEFDAIDVFDLRDGRIVRLSNWYDLILVRRLLAGDAIAR
jgi:ketosteroid isomerase-like protein